MPTLEALVSSTLFLDTSVLCCNSEPAFVDVTICGVSIISFACASLPLDMNVPKKIIAPTATDAVPTLNFLIA